MKWSNETRKLSELIPYEHNPRTMSKNAAKRLKKSLKKTGYAEVIAINLDNVIIAGHQRYNILMDMHGKDYVVDVRIPDRMLTEREFLDYLVASNKDVGDWDYDLLASIYDIDDLLEKGFDVGELGIGEEKEKPKKYKIIIDCVDGDQQAEYATMLDSQAITFKIKG